jgi:GT2 family glycosyltransferase
LFDDASSDGTAAAARAELPQTVIVQGDGSAFWNKGLFLAWQRAQELDPDAYLWLNDDVVLDADALERLFSAWGELSIELSHRRFILVGSTRGSDGELTYSGLTARRALFAFRTSRVRPESHLARVDTFNGNIVLVPREVVEEIGLNDPRYFHNLGDVDYGLRATRAGIEARLVQGTVGVCELNEEKTLRGFAAPGLSWRERWRKVNSHHGLPFKSWWRFTRKFSGPFLPFHFLVPYMRLLGLRR